MRNSKGRKFLTQSTSLVWIILIVIVGQRRRGRGGRGREEGDVEGTLGFVFLSCAFIV